MVSISYFRSSLAWIRSACQETVCYLSTYIDVFSTISLYIYIYYFSIFSLETMLKPVTLFCGHSGCQECFANLIASRNKPVCPLCNEDIPPTTPLNVNVTLNYLTSRLHVICTNTGCKWSGTYDMAEKHSNHCPKVKVPCENDGCHYVDMREVLPSHALSCVKRKIQCIKCGISMADDCLDHHNASLCSYSIMSCPIGCGSTFPR